MQLAPRLSISCNIQHLAQQQSQHKPQWSMFRKELFAICYGQIRQINMVVHTTKSSSDEGKCCLEAERVWALGGLRSLRSKKRLGAEKWQETHILSNEGKETLIEDQGERETAGAKRRVGEAEAAIEQEQEDTRTAEIAGLTTRELEKKIQGIMVAIRDSLSDLASSDHGKDGDDDDDEDTAQGQLSEDDDPGWVLGTISKPCCSEWRDFVRSRWILTNWHNQDGGTQPTTFMEEISSTAHPNWGFQQSFNCKRMMMELHLHPQNWESLRSVLTLSQGYRKYSKASRPGSSHIRLGSGKAQSNTGIAGLAPAAKPDSSLIINAKPIEPVRFYPCIEPP